MSAVALVQGASRGLGLQFCRHILTRRPEAIVIATCRNPNGAKELRQLKEEFAQRLEIEKIDAIVEKEIKEVAERHQSKHGKLDLLINCAAMLHPSGKGETSLRDVSQQGLQDTFLLNTIGPVLMAKHFGDILKKGTGAFGISEKEDHKGILVNMSAKVGSITDNGLGGWYSYRMSKSALNMATKNLSLEFGRGRQRVVCVALHPGTVDTDLSRPYHKNVPPKQLFSTAHSVEQLMNIVNQLSVKDTGKYFNWDGSVLPF